MDPFEQQIAEIEAANAGGDQEMTPGEGDKDKRDIEALHDASLKAKPEVDPEADDDDDDDTLELTDDDEAVDADDDDPDAEEETDEAGKKRRSKPAKQRIAELTARLREAERKLEAQEKSEPEPEQPAPERPNPDDFEYGESDPKYIDALTDWKIESRDHTQREAQKAQAEQQRQQQELASRIQSNLQKSEAVAKEKYPDFDDRIAEATAERGPLSMPVAIGVGLSPAAADIAYRLATDEEASDRLDELARGGEKTFKKFAMAFGELEGEYLNDDSDLDLDDAADMARLIGRNTARVRALKSPQPAKEDKPEVKLTEAPEPPTRKARGGSGRNKPAPDTDDINEFMKHYGRDMGL